VNRQGRRAAQFVQLATTSKNVYALDDAGVVWTWMTTQGRWLRLGGIPADEIDGDATLRAVGRSEPQVPR
jgi:hypothetical protein